MKPVTTGLAIVILLIFAGGITDPPRNARADDRKREPAEPTTSNDPKAEQAKTEEANAVVARGRAEARAAQTPENLAQKAEFQKQARASFAEARAVFQADHDRYKKAYDKYDKFIPKTEKAKYEARELAFRQYVQAQLHLAVLRYEEAQSWDKGSTENKKLLSDAADEFEKIHARYRQLLAGLYARMWQGKCFEEQNDVVKALGLYNELLGHGGGKASAALVDLQDRVHYFRLICLNSEAREDYQGVIREAEEWLRDNSQKAATRTGLGIQWELVRALELQARTERTKAADKTRLLEKALTVARAVHREPGEYKDAAEATIERLQTELNIKPQDE